MTLNELKATLADALPPPGLPALVEALWWAARGEWDRSHEIAQEVDTGEGAWVHAYLHRLEGDAGNAAYWYRRAGRPAAKGGTEGEWEAIAGSLLK